MLLTNERHYYAHSRAGQPLSDWEPLGEHLQAVGARAAGFAAAFGWAELARVAGVLHDIGKASSHFQGYIRGTGTKGPDHSTAGAWEAVAAYPGSLGRILAFLIAGHHAGLADYAQLAGRLAATYRFPAYGGWQDHSGLLPPAAALLGRPPVATGAKGFGAALLIRMLFSCLVDADFLETERFYDGGAAKLARGGYREVAELRDRLRGSMAAMRAIVPASPLNALRGAILDHAVARAASEPGLFTMTVPTGGGKTLASLSFGLEHAVHHGLRRVVYVIPFTSIIEQTAAVFRQALRSDDDVLEHHASFDWNRAAADGDEGADGLGKLRRAAENWDVPVVVTTSVQFYESLFAARTSRCRKLHNLAGAVIIIDEAQSLPLHLLRPCVAALKELAANYRASVVLCTATQPALRRIDEWFDLDAGRELASDPQHLFAALRRVTVERLEGLVDDAAIASRFESQPQMMCIVNSRAHARALFDRIAGLPGAVHLTTLMCPRHRRTVLLALRQRLKDKLPVRLVATSLIEAGVDIDFPEVWRATAGLDAIAQAAGRCNREGELTSGRVVVFEPAEAKPPRPLEAALQAGRSALRQHASDPLGLAGIEAYFRELYWQKGDAALDAPKLDGQVWPILPALEERARSFEFPFASVARAFRMIDDVMEPVIVPWRSRPDDDEADALLRRIGAMERPLAGDLRRLQQYVVSIPPKLRLDWLARGVLSPVHPGLGNELLRFADLEHYRPATGVDITDPLLRAAESNVIG